MLERRHPDPLGDALMTEFGEFLSARMGLHFPPERRAEFERGLAAAARELGFSDIGSCIRALQRSAITRSQLEALASHLTVGETYFFRERQSFECLERHILPQLVQSRSAGERRLRIWSAGCATGEEPYSIAIALARALPEARGWNLSILATDINPRALGEAAQGIYGGWSFRDAPPGIREAFFHKTKDGRFQIAERIRSMVTFGYLNLAEDDYPSVESGTNAMDIVFCRNVLMYFEPARARRALEKLGRSLLDEGWLFVNPVEISHAAVPRLVTVSLGGAIVYRKGESSASRGAESPPVPAWLPAAPAASSPPAQEVPILAATEGAQPEVAAPTPQQQAAALYALGRYADAAVALREAIERDPGDARAMALLARCCANWGDLAAAKKWCSEAVAADRLNPAWHYLLATIVQEQGAAAEAAVALRRALYLDSDHALAHFALGNLGRRQRRIEDSERHYRNALAVLGKYAPSDVLPESEGITAGRLAEIIRSFLSSEVCA